MLKVIWAQLESLVGKKVLLSKLPDTVLVDALTSVEYQPARTSTGAPAVLDVGTNIVQPVFPDDFDLGSLLQIGHTVDRCAINICCLFGAIKQGYLWPITFGKCHDAWNAVKVAAKSTDSKKIWKRVVEAASIENFAHGPFRSGAWHGARKETYETWRAKQTPFSPSFRRAAEAQAELENKPVPSTDDEYLPWFARAQNVRSCLLVTSACKFARWMSVADCWKEIKPDFYFLREVHMELAGGDAAERHLSLVDSTQLLDSELAARMSGKTGLVEKLPRYFNVQTTDALEIFVFYSRPTHKVYSHMTSQLESPEVALDYKIEQAEGKWTDEFRELVNLTASHDLAHLIGHLCSDPKRAETNCIDSGRFLLSLCTERIIRLVPGFCGYPGESIYVLSKQPPVAVAARDTAVKQLKHLTDAEQCCFGAADVDMPFVLNDIFWRTHKVSRFFLYLCDRGRNDPNIGMSEVVETARGHHYDLGTEKPEEDIHQFVRDRTRAKRHKRLNPAQVFEAQIDSSILTDHKVDAPKISQLAVANGNWSAKSFNMNNSCQYTATTEYWDPALDRIADPAFEYESPVVATQMKSAIAWRWLQHVQSERELGNAIEPGDAWWSRLVSKHSLLFGVLGSAEAIIPLFSSTWGLYGLRCFKIGEGAWVPDSRHFGMIDFWPVCSNCDVAGAECRWLHNRQVFVEVGPRSPLVTTALRARRDFTKWESIKAIVQLSEEKVELTELQALTSSKLLYQLICIVFAHDKELRDAVIELYRQPKLEAAGDDGDMDEEMCELVDELLVTEQLNASDLRGWKTDMAKKQKQKLESDRRVKRDERAKVDAAKKRRKLVKKARVFLKGRKKSAAKADDGGKPACPSSASGGLVVPVAASGGLVVPVAAHPEGDHVVDAPGGSKGPSLDIKGDWHSIEVVGGTIRFSVKAGSCDGHCTGHGDGKPCKLDRRLNKGPLGLVLLWLERHEKTTEDHKLQKWACSQDDTLELRRDKRKWFNDEASRRGGLYQLLVDAERDARGGDADEPDSITCPMPR